MENSEILGFKFDPTKTLQPDSKLGRILGKLVHQQIVNQALLGGTKHKLILGACVSTVVKSTTKECLCYHKLNACEYSKKKKRLNFYLLAILQIFFINLFDLINKHAIINLFLIHNAKRQKVIFCISFVLSLVSQFLYCILHNIRN